LLDRPAEGDGSWTALESFRESPFEGASEMWMMSSYGGKLRPDNPIRPLSGDKGLSSRMHVCMRKLGEITNGHQDLRETGRIILSTE